MKRLENVNFNKMPDGEEIEIAVDDDVLMLIKTEPFVTFKSYDNSISDATLGNIFEGMRKFDYVQFQTTFYSDDYNAEVVLIKEGF